MSAVQQQAVPEASASLKSKIKRSDLLKSLNYTQSVVERRGTIPILSNIRLETSDNGLRLTATDMDISVEDMSDATVEVAGATTVPAHTFFDIIRKLPDGKDITLDKSSDDGKMIIRCGSCLLYTSPSPRDRTRSRMPSSA